MNFETSYPQTEWNNLMFIHGVLTVTNMISEGFFFLKRDIVKDIYSLEHDISLYRSCLKRNIQNLLVIIKLGVKFIKKDRQLNHFCF